MSYAVVACPKCGEPLELVAARSSREHWIDVVDSAQLHESEQRVVFDQDAGGE